MNRLRLGKVRYRKFSPVLLEPFLLKTMAFPMDFKFPLELRYLFFRGCPFESLPTDFHAKNLVELDLRVSNIKQLWKENKVLLFVLFNFFVS